MALWVLLIIVSYAIERVLRSLEIVQVLTESCPSPAVKVIFPLLLLISSDESHLMSLKGAVMARKRRTRPTEEAFSLED
ncbi:MAG TPA: hypothetical protein GX721_01570 [Firmicutes bacterium]|nr:hypothetical protein [Bacillota bacterium]